MKLWYKQVFDKYYLVTDIRSLFDDKTNNKEIKTLLSIFKKYKIDKSSKVLDLCGGFGRIAFGLYKNNFKNITVFDFSKFLINLGKKFNRLYEAHIKFVQGDALFLDKTFKNEAFDCVICWGNSFGYLGIQKDIQILKNVSKILKTSGIFILDVPLVETIPLNIILSKHWFSNKNHFILREKNVNTKRKLFWIISSREILLHEKSGLIRDIFMNFYVYKSVFYKIVPSKFNLEPIEFKFNFLKAKNNLGMLSVRNIVIFRKNEK